MKVGSNLQPSAKNFLHEDGQAIAEYATMLAIVLVLVVGMITLIENNALQMFIDIARAVKQ